MIRLRKYFRRLAALALGAAVLAMLVPAPSPAQVFTLSKDELIELTSAMPSTWERFPDGRPKIPDSMLERAKSLSSEEMMGNQYTDGFQILHPGMKMVGRAFTMMYMPGRPELDSFAGSRAQKQGITGTLNNQSIIDMLGPGDVLCVDLFGKKDGGTIVGDNLFYYIMKTTGAAGLVVDGAVRDLEGLARMDMPLYFMHGDPSVGHNITVAGWNVPVKIGRVTVLPGDLVVGDREGITFVSPSKVEKMLDAADTTQVHDEWTRKKFDEGKYKSKDIYGSPSTPELKQEYADYLKKRLEEIRNKRK